MYFCGGFREQKSVVMQNLVRFLFVLVLVSPLAVFANPHNEDNHGPKKELTPEEQKEANKEYVLHHTKDSHDFGLFTRETEHGESHVGFPLPVILWEDGLHVFMSSAFDHGHKVVKSGDKHFVLDYHEGKIYSANADGSVRKDAEGESIAPLDFSITKSVFVSILMCVFMFFLFRSIAKSYKNGLAPKGAAKFLEPIIVFVRDEIALPNIGEKHYKKYMSFLLSVFFFIWFLNLSGMMPFGINVTGNIAFTFALALMVYLITTFTAKKDYWMHIVWMPGVPIPMKIILFPIELLGTIIKPFALMIRLYANMLAGHIVLGMLLVAAYGFSNYFASGAFVGLTFFMNIIELLVALLQAYIFTMLTALYFGAASEEHDHAHAH